MLVITVYMKEHILREINPNLSTYYASGSKKGRPLAVFYEYNRVIIRMEQIISFY